MINVFTDVAAIVFILVCYPLISVCITKKDERQSQGFLEAIKTSMIISTFVFGLIFIIYLGKEIYYIPLVIIIFIVDLSIIISLLVYKIKLNTENQYQTFFGKLNNKQVISLRNTCVALTAIFVGLNYKNFLFPNYKIVLFIGAYVFFFLSCCFGSKISYLKVEK
ncbi:hypothetical protein KTC96_23505 (plasmid) [Clostridium estertheticum]|uniref:hypothetical protein n=1 Tax=Clostridium estertheticum TaxID=238834 RepID=UPI001C6F367B|nr:hypothetical protein [Clostridium estertheticum]MBW9172838.1 hypothetical protein [Clostridium estertheticum]MBX4262800.1 hypothetical protein [Clostridium estertheticum]WLC72859.1 hypothetical protein KTC96_23505 [Clostridium estertheticum]WLC77641.1 hypothetical protein KTC99_23090 [Clostridium estertheticum]